MDFKLAYYDIAFQLVSHYATNLNQKRMNYNQKKIKWKRELSTHAKELKIASHVTQSSSNELSTPVSVDVNVNKRKINTYTLFPSLTLRLLMAVGL